MDDKQYVKGPSNINQTSFKQNEEVITYWSLDTIILN